MHNGATHHVDLYSKKLCVAEQKWPVMEQKLYAIKLSLENWRVYLIGKPFQLFTDSITCKFFLNPARVSCHRSSHDGWISFLSFGLKFIIKLVAAT